MYTLIVQIFKHRGQVIRAFGLIKDMFNKVRDAVGRVGCRLIMDVSEIAVKC